MYDRRIDRAISRLEFNKEVPEDVVTRFEDVGDVLESARENRRMLRVALEYTVITTELALRLLCKQVGFEEPMEKNSDQTLANLLEWLHCRDYLPLRRAEEPEDRPRNSDEEFSRDLPGMYHALRSLRNLWLHTRDASWFGWHSLRVITKQVEFVNRLFDAPRKRREGRKKRREVNRHCQRLKEAGTVLRLEGECQLLYEMNMIHCDVREAGDMYYFAMWPVHNANHKHLSSDEYAPYLAKCRAVCLTDRGSLELITRRGTQFLLDQDLTDDEKNRLGEWRCSKESRHPFGLYLSGPATLRAWLLNLGHHFPIFEDSLNWID